MHLGPEKSRDVVKIARSRIIPERPDRTSGREEIADRDRVVVGIKLEGLDPFAAGIGVVIDIAERRRKTTALVPNAADRSGAAKERPGDQCAIRCPRAKRERERLARFIEGRPARLGSPVQPVDRRAITNKHVINRWYLARGLARVRPRGVQ